MSREQVRITDLKKYFRKYWTPNKYNNKKYLKKYFTLSGCTGVERPIHTYEQRSKYNNSFEKKISLWEGVVPLKGQYI